MITKKENAQNARSTYMIRITVTLTVNGLLYVLGFSFGEVPNCLLSVVLWGVNLLWFMSYRVYFFLNSHIPFGNSFVCVRVR